MSAHQDKVSIGPTTIAGSGVTVAAFVVAVVAFVNGARDEETFSALAVGGLSLLATLGGRYGQAIAQALSYGKGLAPAGKPVLAWGPLPSGPPRPESQSATPLAQATTTSPRPSVSGSFAQVWTSGEGELDPDPPEKPDNRLADPALDEPDAENLGSHTNLKG